MSRIAEFGELCVGDVAAVAACPSEALSGVEGRRRESAVQAPQFITEKVRFAFHGVAISLCGVGALLVPYYWAGALLAVALFVFGLYEVLRSLPALQQSWVVQWIKVRPHEIGTRASCLDFLIGLGLVWLLLPEHIATACFVTAWCDPLARVIGERWGKVKWIRKKTLVGSTTCWLVATVITILCVGWTRGITPVVLLFSTVVGFTAMLAEAIPQWPKHPKSGAILSPADNFCIIVATAAVLCLF